MQGVNPGTIRSKKGNMLLMVAFVVGGIVVVLLIGLGLMLLFSSSSRGKNTTDELVIGAAKVLNSDDRQGRANILVERSRELVFASRKTYTSLSGKYKHLEPLARQIVDEARLGAHAVEDERTQILKTTELELYDVLKNDEKRLAERNKVNMAWFKTASPRITECELGTLRDLDSNVQVPDGFEELKALDLQSEFVNRQSRLYKGNIDAVLPSPDDDMHFKLSALPAPVKRTISGARLLSDERFESQSKFDPHTQKVGFSGKVPCAVRLKITTHVTASERGELSGNVASSSVALTDGGTPAPDEEP
mgnify:CR=1 FL=1